MQAVADVVSLDAMLDILSSFRSPSFCFPAVLVCDRYAQLKGDSTVDGLRSHTEADAESDEELVRADTG